MLLRSQRSHSRRDRWVCASQGHRVQENIEALTTMVDHRGTRPDTAERNRRRAINLAGQRFGRLIVLRKVENRWLCQCDCGNQTITKAHYLRNGDTRSCGCLRRALAAIRMAVISRGPPPYDLTGPRFGRLVASKPAGKDSSGFRWRCRCDCGNSIVVQGRKPREGLTRSCGCLQKEVATEAIIQEHWRRILERLPEKGTLHVIQ